MAHTGILAQNVHGGALCFVSYCLEGVRRLGGHVYPDITLDYIGFGHSLAAAESDGYQAVRALLARSVVQLAGAGANFFVCADNTAHLILDLPGPPLALPGLHLGQVVAVAAQEAGFRRVGILGTTALTSSSLYPDWLAPRGIATEIPTKEDSAVMDDIIFAELVNGITTDSSKQVFLDIIDRFAERGCDAVALVSTEIPTLISAAESPLPVLDSTRLAGHAALRVAVGDDPLPTWRGGPHPEFRATAVTISE